jgi:hydrogenase/urease accessory protein HupE
VLAATALLAFARGAEAHESRPAYLEIRQTAPGRYAILWRTPVLSGQRLPVALRLPTGVRGVSEPVVQELNDSRIERWTIEADSGAFGGHRIEFPGLQATITDVLVRIQMLDGTSSTTLVHASQPWVEMTTSRGRWEMALSYLAYGVQHILFGFDHLLFVLGLLLLVRGAGPLLKTITAFTVAHSITLALATLGAVHLPPPPVEAIIALSIVFLASELVKQQRGVVGLAQQYPWVIAFAFGLLHGFGFAGTLTRVGIPTSDVPLALLMFNLGVELGQLGFVAVCLLTAHSLRSLEIRWPRWARAAPAYAIGSLAAFWVIERITGFWS